MTLAVVFLAGLMAQGRLPARVPVECPRMLLTYAGGLGENRSGLVFALWDSGTIIRAARIDAPEAHVIGVVPAGEAAALVAAVKTSPFWDGDALLAVDAGQDALTLWRPGDRVGRVEASGQRLSPALDDIRRRACGLALSGARSIAAPIDEDRWQCPETI